MKQIDLSNTIKYSKDLTLLYVEDNLELQEQTKKLFKTLFKSVTVVDNGQEAIETYEKNIFNIVISDIKMPIMNGIELTKKIKNINSNQIVIITSAYNESEYLSELINLNVNQFLIKPISMQNLLNCIYTASKNIVNANMIELYRKDLETTNVALKDKNTELQSLVRILDSKIAQISKVQVNNKDINYEKIKILQDHLDELKELETDISGASVLISLSKNVSVSNIHVLSEMFNSYAKVIGKYSEYEELTLKIKDLAISFDTTPDNFLKRVEDISILLESFIYVLRMWRKNLEQREIKKAFELHASMINDISTIISIINGTEDDIESNMEFF